MKLGLRLLGSQVLAAGLVLLWLFRNAQTVDPEVHNQVVADLRELQARDLELGENALRLHFRLEANYDRIVAVGARMRELAAALEAHQSAGRMPDTPARCRCCRIGSRAKGSKWSSSNRTTLS